jgi:hypothetical protein
MQISGAEFIYGKLVESPSPVTEPDKPLKDTDIEKAPSVNLHPTVAFSGKSLLMTRVFFCTKPNYEPPVITELTDNTYSMSCANFLTKEDRGLFEDMYEYAQEQGADLRYVDALAFSLGYYRQSDNPAHKIPQSMAGHHTLEGRKVVYAFTEKDAATAKRILNSEALNTTRLNEGFIRYTLDQEYGVLGHGDFAFMEKMINTFSATDDGAPLERRFHNFVDNSNDFVKHVAEEITLHSGGKDERSTDVLLSAKSTLTDDARSVTPDTLTVLLRRVILSAINPNGINGLRTLADVIARRNR